jgi:hypothetical protein
MNLPIPAALVSAYGRPAAARPAPLKRLLREAALHNAQAYLAVPAGYTFQRRDGGTVNDGSDFYVRLDLGVKYFLA